MGYEYGWAEELECAIKKMVSNKDHQDELLQCLYAFDNQIHEFELHLNDANDLFSDKLINAKNELRNLFTQLQLSSPENRIQSIYNRYEYMQTEVKRLNDVIVNLEDKYIA